MEIYAKSSFNNDLIAHKLELGADAIEIQLLGELFDANSGGVKNLTQAFGADVLQECINQPIKAIHCPLGSYVGKTDSNLEDLDRNGDNKIFFEVCKLAELISVKHDWAVSVIIHMEINKSKLDTTTSLYNAVKENIGYALYNYPHIKILIENVTPIREFNNDTIELCSNFTFSNCEFVRTLRSIYYTDRIGTVLDTCHAEVSNQIISILNNYYYHGTKKIDYSLERYFEENADVIGLIHLSKTIGNGEGPTRHGQPFDDCIEDKLHIQNIIKLYEKYQYSCPITLEVAETDYAISDGFERSNKIFRGEINTKGSNELCKTF